MSDVVPTSAVSHQRLDKWLFFVRAAKSRSLAQRMISDGHVRVNDLKVTQPSRMVKPGDIVAVSLDRRDITLRVVASGTRRGPFEEARLLYDDLTPARPAVPDPASALDQALRERGSGRPTKRERRDLDRLRPDFGDG